LTGLGHGLTVKKDRAARSEGEVGAIKGIAMTRDQLADIAPTTGEEFRPSLGKLWAMLFVFAVMVPVGALAAYLWWNQVELPGGIVLTAQSGVVGLLALPLGILLALVAAALLASAKRLVIGDDCVQLMSRGRVVVHIPYQNIAQTYTSGRGSAGVVGLMLRDRNDPATLVPPWTRDRYEIQVLIYGKPLEHIYQVLDRRLATFRGGGG
jgi:hypothetical protein